MGALPRSLTAIGEKKVKKRKISINSTRIIPIQIQPKKGDKKKGKKERKAKLN